MNFEAARPPRMGIGHAPGKLLLVGEHAVVFGKPALAVPFWPVGAHVIATPESGPLNLNCELWGGAFTGIADVPPEMAGLAAATLATLAWLELPAYGWRLAIDATVPVGAGLGSSASVAVALVRSLFNAQGLKPDQATLLELAGVAEGHAHRNASGVDAAVIAQGVPLSFQRGEPAETLRPGAPLHLVVAHSGRPRDTGAAVAAVQAALKENESDAWQAVDRLGALAVQARAAFEGGNAEALGSRLDDAQEALTVLGVSDPALDRLVGIARVTGALGAKLTGAGRGGCVLALAADAAGQAKLSVAFAGAGVKQTWSYTLRPEGVAAEGAHA